MSEIFSSKDMEGLLQAMIFTLGIWHRNPELDQTKVYYVLQGPRYWMDRLWHLNSKRTKIIVQRNPHSWDDTSPVYFSNTPEHPNAFKFNAHYGTLRATQSSNKLGHMIFPLPDFGKVNPENTINTAYETPNADMIDSVVKKGY